MGEVEMNYCYGCMYYHTFNSLFTKHHCLAHTYPLVVTPSDHKPAFCAGHSEKEKKMSDIKLKIGQIWLTGYDNTEARKILHIGETCVFYARIDSEGTVIEETAVSLHGFLSNYAVELLPCWPPEPELKEITCGFHATISVDKEGNIVIPKSTLDNLIAGYKAVMGVKE